MSIRVGDALACLRAMPAASVHCCVTSPPYWGLRDYGTPPQIWGGDPDCRHRWGDEGKSGQRLRDGKYPRVHCLHPSTGAFCTRCGAWRGSLGLEPDYRLYVDHLVAVIREVHRVLRRDGTLWLNLGDCYATGAGKAYRGTHGADPKAPSAGLAATQPNRMPQPGLKPKDLSAFRGASLSRCRTTAGGCAATISGQSRTRCRSWCATAARRRTNTCSC